MPQSLGRSIPRKEGKAKVTGSARYVDDVTLPGMVFGATVRSSVPRGIIRDISYKPGVPWDEFTVVTAADIPGSNRVALIVDDQPYLASDRINHPEEPVVLLAHPDRQMVELASTSRRYRRRTSAGRVRDRGVAGGAHGDLG